jgi:hypothetical protein
LKDEEDSQIFIDARTNLLQNLDPSLTEDEKKEQSNYISSVFSRKPEDRAKIYGRCVIEFYGLLNMIKDRIIIGAITDDEIREIIGLLLDIDRAEKILVKRFIDPNMREEDMRPFIGQENPEVKLTTNFLEKHISGGDREFYKYRIFQLWVRNLLNFDKQAAKFIEDEKSYLFKHFMDIKQLEQVLFTGIKLHGWYTQYQRLLTLFKTDYASKRDFKGFASEIIHLITARNSLLTALAEDSATYSVSRRLFSSTKV